MKWIFFQQHIRIPYGNAALSQSLPAHRLPRQVIGALLNFKVQAGKTHKILPSLQFQLQEHTRYRIVLWDLEGKSSSSAWIGKDPKASCPSLSPSIKSHLDFFSVQGDFSLSVEWDGPAPGAFVLDLHRQECLPHFQIDNINCLSNKHIQSLCQYHLDPQIGPRICSPTSTAMALGLSKREALKLARLIYHAPHDLYGIWPMATYWAQRLGAKADLFWLKDTQYLIAALRHYGCLCLSIRVSKNSLPHFPLEHSAGHLCLLHSINSEFATVYDPAQPSAPTLYPTTEFLKCLRQSGGLAYGIRARPDLRKHRDLM